MAGPALFWPRKRFLRDFYAIFERVLSTFGYQIQVKSRVFTPASLTLSNLGLLVHQCCSPDPLLFCCYCYRGGAVEVLGLYPAALCAAHLEACDSVQRCSPYGLDVR